MADVVGRGIIELIADGRKFRAGLEEAKQATRTFAEGQKATNAAALRSIDNYVSRLQQQAATLGKSGRETELYRLAVRGASNEQLAAANTALRSVEIYERKQRVLAQLNTAFIRGAAFVATFSTALIVGASRSINFLDRINDLSKSTNITVEDLAGLSLLARQTGTDLDGLAKGIQKMTVEIGKDPAKFKELGVTAGDALGQFKQLADIFNRIPDMNLRNALAQKVFSKSWQELAPALSEGSRGIEEAVEKGRRLSGITTEMAKKADEFNDRLEELKITTAAFGSRLLPGLTELVSDLLAARDATNGLVSAVKNLLILKTGAFGKDFAEQIKSIDESLERNRKIRAATRGAIVTEAILDVRDERLKGLRNTVIAVEEARKLRLREQALALGGADSPGERIRAGLPSGARADTDRAAQEAAARARKFLEEQKKADDNARAEAAAQLQFDIDQIRKASEATLNAFANGERIMEAMRAAALVNDREYYEAKLRIINVAAEQEEAAIRQEIDRLKREEFSGKTADQDRINNLRKIADAEARIAKVRQDAAVKSTINAIEEKKAQEQITKSLIEATKASEAYLETLERRNALELAGIGRGNRVREELAGAAEIDRRFAEERRKLEGELRRKEITQDVFDTYLAIATDTYEREVEMYRDRTARIRASEADWVTGATEAFANYADEARNVAKQTENLFTNALRGLEDAFVDLAKTGKLNFKDLIDSIISDLIRLQVRKNIVGPLAEIFGIGAGAGSAGGRGGGGGVFGGFDLRKLISGDEGGFGMLHFAGGGSFRAGDVAIVGERGPELVRFGSAGSVTPNHALRSGDVNVVNNYHIDARSDRAEIVRIVEEGGARTQRAVMESLRRGGSFARATGNA